MNNTILSSYEKNRDTLLSAFASDDVVAHDIAFGRFGKLKGCLMFIDGLVRGVTLNDAVIRPLLTCILEDCPDDIAFFAESLLFVGETTPTESLSECADGLMGGSIVFFCDGLPQALLISAKGWDKRSVTEPQTETVVRGSREGFTENFRTNTSLLRRRIKSLNLRIEQQRFGKQSGTHVALVYIEGIVNQNVLDTLRERLSKIDTDSILDAGNLEQYIEDSTFSVFPRISYTEKPDVAAAKILEGRIGLVVEGSPFVLCVPMLFIEGFQSSEDYNTRTFYATFSRLMRFGTFLIATLGPAIFIALTTFHQELLPTELLLTIARAREATPFPAYIEALIMVIAFEILREAGLRLPRPVGQAISIVGALIMGEAAVSAGLVGPPMVTTIALTAVAGFVVPEYNDTIIAVRFLCIITAAFMGGFGITMMVLLIFVRLAMAKSFGVNYLSGLAPADIDSAKDALIRAPLWSMRLRPRSIVGSNLHRRGK